MKTVALKPIVVFLFLVLAFPVFSKQQEEHRENGAQIGLGRARLPRANDTPKQGRSEVLEANSPSVEIFNLVLRACSSETLRRALADGGRLGDTTMIYDLFQEGERGIQINILRGGLAAGGATRIVGNLVVQRRPAAQQGNGEGARRFDYTCEYVPERE